MSCTGRNPNPPCDDDKEIRKTKKVQIVVLKEKN